MHTEGRTCSKYRRYHQPGDDSHTTHPSSSWITVAPIPPDPDKEDEHLWPIPLPEMDEVLDTVTGRIVNLQNKETIEENMKDKDHCFLDPPTGFLINSLSNFRSKPMGVLASESEHARPSAPVHYYRGIEACNAQAHHAQA